MHLLPLSTILSAFGILACLPTASSAAAQTAAVSEPKPPHPETVMLEDALEYSADDSSPVQLEATLLLADLALQDDSARPAAIRLVLKHLQPGGNRLIHSAAEVAAQKIGKKMLPEVKEALASKVFAEHAAACGAIKLIGPDAIELLPQLMEFLESGDVMRQRAALYAIQGFGNQAFEAIDTVAACLQSSDFNVQCMACRVLEKYGSDALPAEASLVNILATGVPSSRGWAAIALGAIGPTDQHDVVPMLVASLRESHAHVEKQRILLGMAHLGREAQRAIPTVKEYLKSRSHRVQPHAAYALYKIANEKDAMDQVLLKALEDINQRDDAFDLIQRLDAEEAVSLQAGLVKLLTDEDEGAREKAVLAIGRLGPLGKDALPKVQKLLKDSDALVRDAAAQAIASLTYEPEKEEDSE